LRIDQNPDRRGGADIDPEQRGHGFSAAGRPGP
jgi:hypothetical protein